MSTLDLTDAPAYCAHEHWGSINPIGHVPEGFRADVECGAKPRRRTGLLDIVLDPYFGGWLSAAGVRVDEVAQGLGAPTIRDLDATRAMAALRPALAPQALTGAWQCIRRGTIALHGADIAQDDGNAVAQADQSIAAAYAGMFGWYRKAMSAAHLSALIRPVHPLFYMRNETPDGASAELAFTRTVMRIDPLLGLTAGTSPERDDLAEAVGVGPDEAGSWRRFLAALFELAAGRGCVGIKQLQAYSRPLEFRQVSDTEVVWHGQRTPEQQRVFQDWVVHECCALANDRGWPHQVHVGTHNLAQSNPLPLSRLAERYRRMTIVQLHCWPFLNECGWLAKHHANIAIDTCWMPILSPSFLREALRLWLPYVPATKVMMSQDATSIEMAAGSALFVRELLAEALTECARPLGLAASDLQRIAASMLHDNAAAVYRTGEVRCGMM